MGDIAIKIENLSKQYRLGVVGTGTLSHDLKRWWTVNVRRQEDPYLKIGETNDRASKGMSDYVWALKDINLEIKQGDVVGIIGKNGAGKSTLLKILSRVTKPTTGSIDYKGRIASLLEVGTGFHPEMTGRENIYMNGAIMGMSRAEITRKLDEIIAFAGVERYIDTPVKRYSSGMTVRLGFSIAAHLEPDILVVDEVLAVGDAEFQKKAIGKMQDVSKGEGRTVLFVSHNMAAIESLCKTGILIHNGRIDTTNEIRYVISKYLGFTDQNKFVYDIKLPVNFEEKVGFFTHLQIENFKGEIVSNLDIGSDWQIRVFFEMRKFAKNFVIGLAIVNQHGIPINTTHSLGVEIDKGSYEAVFKNKTLLYAPGTYRIIIAMWTYPWEIHYVEEAGYLTISEIRSDNFDQNIRLVPNTGDILNPMEFSLNIKKSDL